MQKTLKSTNIYSFWWAAVPLVFLSLVALFFFALPGNAALADEVVSMANLQQRVDATQQEVERTSAEYNEATANAEAARTAAEKARNRVVELDAQIKTSQETIEQASIQLIEQKQRSADAMRLQYKMEAEGLNLTDLMLSSSTISEFFSTLDYMDHIQDLNSSEMKKYNALKEEYETALKEQEYAKTEAEAQRAIAEEEEQRAVEEEARAEDAMKAAQEARVKAQEEAEAEMARRALEIEASALDNDVDWKLDRSEFIDVWTKRIDAYLAGSPMDGCGAVFAEAAWDYGVDPRWSPAIACVESGKGVAVPYYTSNNAWGWFANATNFRIFSSFEEGARLHVEYLAKYYGYTVTLEHAAVYCPPGEEWYEAVVKEMAQI